MTLKAYRMWTYDAVCNCLDDLIIRAPDNSGSPDDAGASPESEKSGAIHLNMQPVVFSL